MPDAGWYDDPQDDKSVRYWDGQNWTKHKSDRPTARPSVANRQPPATKPHPAAPMPRPIVTGAATAVSGPLSNRTIFLIVAAAVVLLVMVVTSVGAMASAGRSGDSNVAALVDATATPRATPVATPSAKPTPKVTYVTEDTISAVPFGRVAVNDGSRDAGTSAVTTPGVDGQMTTTFKITLRDGVEVSREQIAQGVSLAPIDEVTSVGTYVPPAPIAAAPAPGGGCDSNYAGQCVPIASDVDCGGGSGNGPAYVWGPVTVVGSDIYDLDRDGDGIACDA